MNNIQPDERDMWHNRSLTWFEFRGTIRESKGVPIKIGWSCKMSEKDSESSKGELTC